MSDTPVKPENEKRRVHRRLPRADTAATYWRQTPATGPGHTAQLHDISEDGLRLLVGQALEPGSEIEVSLVSPDSTAPVVRVAVIVWCAAQEAAYMAGARFLTRLCEAELALLT